MHGDHKGKIQCQDMGKCKIQGQDMEVTRVKSKVKIWKSQVQDHEMIESNGKEENYDQSTQSSQQASQQACQHCADPLSKRRWIKQID